jgi:glycosyltransferase involved in cell wall biosynthesis
MQNQTEAIRVTEVIPTANTCALDKRVSASASAPTPPVEIEVGLLTGGIDKPYAFGLAMALISRGVCLDFIGSDEVDSPELHISPNLRFLNLRGRQGDASLATKIRRILSYYGRLLRYAAVARPKIFHILWNNRFQIFDRTVLMLYYKLQRKKIAFTAHNVNAGKRDSKDSFINRLTLRIQYQLADHIFVHTGMMKSELIRDFGVREGTVTVIPFGINNSVPHTADLSPEQAKQRLGIRDGERTILFFGRIGPYKGLEFLVAAFQQIVAGNGDYRLIIVGRPKRGDEKYLDEIQKKINRDVKPGRVIQKIEFVPDEETELYFKAADVFILPYTEVFQSGVLFLGYSFGLPVIASDVGSLRDSVVEGRTGLLCKPCDPVDLARAIETYFESDLFKTLATRRQEIRDFANQRHSWEIVGRITTDIYATLLGRNPS